MKPDLVRSRVAVVLALLAVSCSTSMSASPTAQSVPTVPVPKVDLPAAPASVTSQTAVFAAGCFWCSQAVFKQLNGVTSVEAGYAGGSKDTANYQVYATDGSNQAEAVQITFDPHVITYGKLLQVLFATSEPTVKDQQGPDAGHQYRMAVFYLNNDQKAVTEAYIKQLTDAKVYSDPIQTTVEPLPLGFFAGEAYHQDYVDKHPDEMYIQMNSIPKLESLHEHFKDELKPDAKIPGK